MGSCGRPTFVTKRLDIISFASAMCLASTFGSGSTVMMESMAPYAPITSCMGVGMMWSKWICTAGRRGVSERMVEVCRGTPRQGRWSGPNWRHRCTGRTSSPSLYIWEMVHSRTCSAACKRKRGCVGLPARLILRRKDLPGGQLQANRERKGFVAYIAVVHGNQDLAGGHFQVGQRNHWLRFWAHSVLRQWGRVCALLGFAARNCEGPRPARPLSALDSR